MILFIFALLILLLGGIGSLLMSHTPRIGFKIGSYGAIAGSLIGLISTILMLINGLTETAVFNWGIPGAEISLEIDGLSGFFLTAIFFLSTLSGIYGSGYLDALAKKAARSWFWFNWLIISMAIVVASRNTILFLFSWEIMSLSSFFLVIFDGENEASRDSAWIYLIATHIGTAFLTVMFLIAGSQTGSFDFNGLSNTHLYGKYFADLFFIFSVIGFGVKAGFFPMHVWLPEAHPAAPSHVSALMSGVMIKTGIYALIRFVLISGTIPAWWGFALVIIGISSGILGVIFALAQHDIKRLLAYHSMENIGIICLGLGIGLLGISYNQPVMVFLGLAGGLMHVLNHSLFKGLLFLSAGAVMHSTHERNIEKLGGLLKRMPVTGASFLIGAIAICGLPPLNGFISEWLIFSAALQGVLANTYHLMIPSISVIIALVIIGGLALACFTKAFGIGFLGEPRNKAAAQAHDPGTSMKFPMLAISLACIAIGVYPLFFISAISKVFALTNGLAIYSILPKDTAASMQAISLSFVCLILLITAIVVFRKYLSPKAKAQKTVTWDCGYAQPNSRMQYTASSFAQPFLPLIGFFQKLSYDRKLPEGVFPSEAHFESHSADIARAILFNPLFRIAYNLLHRIKVMQQGRVQIYVLYIALTLLLLIIFGM
ncbi:MAG: proton-conducting transporter membrane subunit [Candidatus Brocadiia bacterium]